MPQHETTNVVSQDGLHCVYGKCQGFPRHPRPCNPGCYFQMSTLSNLELLRRHVEKGNSNER